MATFRERARIHDTRKTVIAIILAVLAFILCFLVQAPAQLALTPTATVAAATATTAPRPTNTGAPNLAAPTVNAEADGGKLTLTGAGTPGSKVQIVIDGAVAGTADVGSDGTWAFNTDLNPGDHDIVVNALDAGGAVAASAAPVKVTVAGPITAPKLDAFAANLAPGKIAITGTGTPNREVQVVIDGAVAGIAKVDGSGKWTFDADLEAGDHTIQANALDAGGAVAAAAAPAALKLADASTGVTAPTLDVPTGALTVGKIPLTGTGAPGTKVQIVIGGSLVGEVEVDGDGKWAFDGDFPNAGAIPVVVNALDAEGQVAAASDTATLTVGAAATAPTLDTLNASYPVGTAKLSGTGAPNSKVQIVINGQPAGTADVDADGKWTFNGNFPSVGDYTVQVNALDASGQVVAASQPSKLTAAERARNPCALPGQQVYGTDQGSTWLVGPCDTLTYISRRTGVSVQAMLDANKFITNPDLIYPGWVIALPGRQ